MEMDFAEVDASEAIWSQAFEQDIQVGQQAFFLRFYDDYLFSNNFGEPLDNETMLVCGAKEVDVTYPNPEDPGNNITETKSEHFGFFYRNSFLASGGDPTAGTYVEAELRHKYTDPPAFYRVEDGSVIQAFTPFYFTARTARWTIRATPFDGSFTYGTFTIVILGQEFEVPLYAINSRSSLPEFTNTLNVSARLEPLEYWPYDPGDDGGPIYDSTTGQQLRAFPS